MTAVTPVKFAARINQQVLPESTASDRLFDYIDIGSVGSDGVISRPAEPIAFADAPSRARRLAPAGSTIVSTVRTYLRAIAYVDDDLARTGVFSTGFAVLEPRAGFDARYFHYACRSEPFVEEIVARSVGVSYPAIAPSDLGDLPVPTRSLDAQRRIADFLDDQVSRIDEAARLRREQIEALREVEHSRLSAEFDELGEQYGWMPLRRWTRGIEQGWSPLCEARPAGPDESGILKLGAVRSGRFRPNENKALPFDLPPDDRYRVNAGDLLVSRANTPQLVGEAAVVPEGMPGNLYLCDLLYRVFLRLDAADFVSAALRTRRARSVIGVVARGTSQSMVKLRGEDIYDIPVPNAPTQARVRAMHVVDGATTTTDAVVSEMTAQIDLLQERKRSLITSAVTGEFDVTTASGRGIQ